MKNKMFKKKVAGAIAWAMAMIIGATPMTAFAQANPEGDAAYEEKVVVSEKERVDKEDVATVAGEQEPDKQETFGPLTPDGNLTLVDDYGSVEAGGKQFITVVTKAGNYFYIIIDRDDEGDETVHFLNMVDESDLLKLMDDEEAQAYVESVAGAEDVSDGNVEDTEKEPAGESEESEAEEEPAEEKKSSKSGALVLLLLVAVGGVGGFLYFTKGKKKTVVTVGVDPDADYRDEEEDYLAGLAEDDFEDEEIAKEFDEEAEETED